MAKKNKPVGADNAAEIFEALPDVNELWFTEDGHYHLHPHKGGEKVTRPKEDELEIPAE